VTVPQDLFKQRVCAVTQCRSCCQQQQQQQQQPVTAAVQQ
jgi:hypothetical protein